MSRPAKIEREITPEPIMNEPARNPELPAWMSAMLADARKRKLRTIPPSPHAIKRKDNA